MSKFFDQKCILNFFWHVLLQNSFNFLCNKNHKRFSLLPACCTSFRLLSKPCYINAVVLTTIFGNNKHGRKPLCSLWPQDFIVVFVVTAKLLCESWQVWVRALHYCCSNIAYLEVKWKECQHILSQGWKFQLKSWQIIS